MAPENIFRIKNFKNLEDIQLELKPLTFLFGSNGSGKSTLLKALKFFETNLIPHIKPKANYNINDYIDLGNFSEIATNNDITKKVSIGFIHKYENKWLNNNTLPYRKFIYKNTPSKRKDINGFVIDDKINKFEILNKTKKIKSGPPSELAKLGDANKFIGLNREEDGKSYYVEHHVTRTDDFSFSLKLEFSYDSEGLNTDSLEIKDLNNNTELKYYLKKGRDVKYNYLASVAEREIDKPKPDFYQIAYQRKIKIFDDPKIDELFGDFYDAIFLFPFIEYDLEDVYYSGDGFKFQDDYQCTEMYGDVGDVIRKLLKYYIFNELQGKNEWEQYSPSNKKHIFFFILQFIERMYNSIPKIIDKELRSSYLPTTRELPKHNYLLKNGEFGNNDYYGYLNNLIDNRENLSKGKNLNESINNVISYYNFGKSLTLKRGKDIAKIFLNFKRKGKCNLAEASSGLLQVLPIFIESLLCGWGGVTLRPTLYRGWKRILIEQPELHLHPKLQSQLAAFFADDNANDFIIETHSEHLIKQIQIYVAKGELKKEKVGIYFFDTSTGTAKIVKMEIQGNGFFQTTWPAEFFDDNYKLTKELLFASLN